MIDRLQRFPNQNTDKRATECCGETVADIAGNIQNQPMDPGFSYAAALRVQNVTPTEVGTIPYAAMVGAVVYGTLPTANEPFDATSTSELYEANWANYNPIVKHVASLLPEKGITTYYSYADICDYLDQDKQGVALTVTWYESFLTPLPDGSLPTPSGATTSHCVAVYGYDERGLQIKPWLGPTYGQGGYAYLPQALFPTIFESAYAFNLNGWRWGALASIAVQNIKNVALLNDIIPMLSPSGGATINTVKPSQTPLDVFCTAIRDYEGAPGDANYKNNNPGNCRYNPSGYLPKYGKVTKSPSGFAIFPTYEQGWEYLETLVSEMVHNHPQWNFSDFFKVYAPSTDGNNPDTYAAFVAKRLGVDVSNNVLTTLKV